MKAEMTAGGVITLTAETSIEAFALRHWVDGALVMQPDERRRENCHWRGSRLTVTTTPEEQACG